MLTLRGRSGIVTGAGSGIGRAVSLYLAKAGAALRLVDLDYDGMVGTVAALTPCPAEVHCHKVDVTDPHAFAAIVGKCEFFGGPDFVVHCAGVRGGGEFHKMPVEEWDRVIDTNLFGAANVCQVALESMVRTCTKGSIVLISSMTGLISNGPGFHNAHYACSKAGVNGLVKALAVEYAPYGIRVNAVLPGPVVTPMTDAFKEKNPKLYEEFFGRIPLGPGYPEDVAGMVLLLVSSWSRWITGSLIVVDGGYSSW